jgi:RNA 2',3'-cyclic 3'-phosphodiesterase
MFFISINLPEGIKTKILDSQENLYNSGAKMSLVGKDKFHLTLKFLDNLNLKDLEFVLQKLKNIKIKKFTLSLDGIGFFQDSINVRVIWVGLSPKEEVNKLQRDIDDALSQNFEKEPNFVPHITIARVKCVEDQELFARKTKQIKVQHAKFDVSSFSLMKSISTSSGPAYDEIKKFD